MTSVPDARRQTNRSRDIDIGPVPLDGLGTVATQPTSDLRARRGRHLAWKAVTEANASNL